MPVFKTAILCALFLASGTVVANEDICFGTIAYGPEVKLDGSDFTMQYCINESKTKIKYKLSLKTTADRWFGVGWSHDGIMEGTDSVIAIPGSGIEKYHLAGYAANKLSEDRQDLEDVSITDQRIESGKLCAYFTRLLTPRVIEDNVEVEIPEGEEIYFLWAYGNGQSLSYHSRRGSLLVDFSKGEASDVTISTGKGPILVHGILMGIVWLVMLPASIYAAITKDTFMGGKGAWIKFHKACAFFGVLLQSIAYYLVRSSSISYGDISDLHITNGTIVTAIGTFVMPFLGLIRPPATKKGEERTFARFVWEMVHKNIGRVVLVMAFLNVQSGAKIFAEENGAARISVLVLTVVAIILLGYGAKLKSTYVQKDRNVVLVEPK